MRSYLIAAPAQKMEACLVDVVVDVLMGDSDVLLSEETLVATDEAKHLGVLCE